MSDRVQIARVDEYGLGVVMQQHAHYAEIQFNTAGHLWRIIVDNDDYEIVDEFGIGHEELE